MMGVLFWGQFSGDVSFGGVLLAVLLAVVEVVVLGW